MVKARATALTAGALAALLLTLSGCGSGGGHRAPIPHRGTPSRPPAPTGEEAAAARHAGPCSTDASPLPMVRPLAPLLIGISANLRSQSGRGICTTAALVRRSGAAAVREDLEWARVQPRPGPFHWGYYDRVAATAAQRGLVLLPLLDDTPGWAGRGPQATSSSPAQFASFVAAAVARYGPGGTFWQAHPQLAGRAPRYFELYNEPYGTPDAQGGPDPEGYAHDVIAAVTAGRQANPRASYLLAADLYTAGSDESWVEALYRVIPAFRDYVAGVAVHPYGEGPVGRLLAGTAGRSDVRRVEEIEAIMRAHGDSGVPLWLTEIGWPSCSGQERCVGEAGQARDLQQLFALARGSWRSFVRAVFVYQLHDYGPGTGSEPEEWYGLLRPDGTAKPAWKVLQTAAREDTAPSG
jgi:hypothetical protein